MNDTQLVKFKRKSTDEIESLPIEDGSLIYDYETGKTYMDYHNDRIPTGGGGGTSDIVMVNEEPTEDTKLLIESEDLDFQGSEIVDEYSDSNAVGYSASYTNARNTYSTDEVDTGKTWIDGKPIYRKVVAQNRAMSNGSSISLSSLNYETLIDIHSIEKIDNNIWIDNYYDSSTAKFNLFYYNSGNSLYLYAGSNANYTVTVWIEYTKTS